MKEIVVVARSAVYRKLAYSGIAVAMFVGMNSSAFAAACLGPANLTSVDVSGFTANPAVLLDMSDPLVLSSRVRALVGSSNDALSPVIEQAKKANVAQMAAIGSGLGRAANSCQVTDPQFKLAIEKAVADAASADPNLAPLLCSLCKGPCRRRDRGARRVQVPPPHPASAMTGKLDKRGPERTMVRRSTALRRLRVR